MTTFRYDRENNLTSLTDPNGNQTRFAYDARNRLVREIDPLGEAIVYTYDPVDNLINKTDRNGREINYDYDVLNQLTTETWVNPDSSVANVVTYAYDDASNLTSIVDDFSALAFTYDNRDRILTVDNAGTPNAPNVVLTYSYDAVGNVLSVADTIEGQPGALTSYAYDAINRMAQVSQTGVEVSDKRVDFAYNQIGQFSSIDRFSDLAGTQLVVATTYTYDILNRLVDLRHTNTTEDVAFYEFTYDDASRITQIVDIDGTTAYTYDDTDQLVAADHSDEDNPDETYEYDANGNRVDSHLHGTGYVTGPGNRLVSDGTFNYEYDDEGNLILRTEISTSNVREFQFDHRNRLVAVIDKDSSGVETQRVEFTYDALNRRISKSVDTNPQDAIDAFITHFVYDGEDVILDFIDSDGLAGPSEPSFDKRYVHGPAIDQVLAEEDAASNTVWYLTDHLGTVRDLVAAAGLLVNHIKYDMFGRVISETDSAVGSRYSYTGREIDQEIDLMYYRSRYFDSVIGRFISEDGLRAIPEYNLFLYVSNNPISTIDPFGTTPYGTYAERERLRERAWSEFGSSQMSSAPLSLPPFGIPGDLGDVFDICMLFKDLYDLWEQLEQLRGETGSSGRDDGFTPRPGIDPQTLGKNDSRPRRDAWPQGPLSKPTSGENSESR